MYGQCEGELWFHRWHMWPVPSSSTPSVAPQANSFEFIDALSFSKDGRKINVGDCALFEPPYSSPPFVGRICKVKLGKQNYLSLCVNWLYRPADIKLKEGALLEAAPNEVFYSFHKDEIPAASLLHPCKVTFLPKGVQFPSGISSFVCRQVYDVESERLWWLTDRNYINELQEEVNQLLDKTLIEMHGAVQAGGRSPKPLNGPNGSAQLKPSSDNVQNGSSSISSRAKSKKQEHGVHISEKSVKRDRFSKVDNADSCQLRPEHILKTEIAKITNRGGLVDVCGVEKLLQLLRPSNPEKKLNLACKKMLVDVISGTDKFDRLGRFIHLRVLLVLDEWLQEVHKGKISDGSCKENDKSVEEFLFSLLCALDKLPVNLHALQTCNVGKSVNHLRSHKNSEIQKKARSLVSRWKRHVEAEMNIIETKSSLSRGRSWPKVSEVSHTGGARRLGRSSYEAGPKSSSRPSALKTPQPKESSGEAITKSPTSLGSTNLSLSSVTKEGRSCGSSQSPNNSQKEVIKACFLSRNISSENGSPTRPMNVPLVVNGNIPRLIIRLPNTARSPTQTASLESPEDSSTLSGKGSLLEASIKHDRKASEKFDSLQGDNAPNSKTNTHTNMGNDLSGEKGLIVCDEEHGKKDASFGSGSSSGVTPKPSKLYEPSYGSINALVESCAQFSEVCVSPSIGDAGGINLLASVAAGEMSTSDVSPTCSPDCNSTVPEDLFSVNVTRLAHDGHIMVEQICSVGAHENNTGSVNLSPEEDKCPSDKPIGDTVDALDAAATSVKSETTHINEDPASWSSSGMDDDEKKLVHERLTVQPVAITSCGDAGLATKSVQTDENMTHLNIDSRTSVSEHAHENTGKDVKTPLVAAQVKLDFDLNEGFPIDNEVDKAAVHAPHPSLSKNKTVSGLITVAAAAKGPFHHSESLSGGKPDLGWKGSAATSAFRAADPQKVDAPVSDSKPARILFDFDLNVGVDDAGLNVDSIACEKNHVAVQLSVGTSNRPFVSALSNLPNSSMNSNLNGRGKKEVGDEFFINSMQLISGVPNVETNNMNIGNFSTWFPPNNSYPAFSNPSQRMLTHMTSNSSFTPEILKGGVLSSSSSPAVVPPSTKPVQYTAFPNIPSVGPNGLVSMPCFMSLSRCSSNAGPDGRKWGSQCLDLNTGLGDDMPPTGLRQLPLGGGDEQLRMFHQMAAGGGVEQLRMFHQMAAGGVLKRKEPDGGWDGDNKISYKHVHQQ